VNLLVVAGVLVFVVGVVGSLALHEAGHFFTARRFGMKATQFFVGFGPTLWSTRRGETEYGVKAIPAGAFVKIVGMTPLEEVEPGEEARSFYKHPTGRKTIVLAAGALVQFALCILLVLLVTAVIGVPEEDHPRVASVASCVDDKGTGDCDVQGAVPAPAKEGGLRADDRVLFVDGTSVRSAAQLRAALQGKAGETVRMTIRRDDREFTVPITPKLVNRDGKAVGAIGVVIGYEFTMHHYGPVGIVRETGSTLKLFVTGTWDTFTEKLGTVTKLYSPDRDPSGFVGLYGAGRISGEVAAQEDVPLSFKVRDLLLLIAGLNLFVGIFNLIPLLPLDGGHIAVALYEQARDKVRRARGYTGELQRVDMNKLMPLTFAAVLVFAGFTLFLLGADIVNPITLN
jgi:membrane-associated protease RseP (regulator of RpoE activity)